MNTKLTAAVESYLADLQASQRVWWRDRCYRERDVLGRPLEPQEVQHFTDTARRIAAILLIVEGSNK